MSRTALGEPEWPRICFSSKMKPGDLLIDTQISFLFIDMYNDIS